MWCKQSLTYVQVRSKQFKDSICYTCKSIISHSKFNNLTRLCCNRKVVANVQLFFTFAMVCDHWVNAVFTIFALRANIIQLKKLHLSKYEQSLSNVTFTFYLLRFCYGCKSVFFVQCNTWLLVHIEFLFTMPAHVLFSIYYILKHWIASWRRALIGYSNSDYPLLITFEIIFLCYIISLF